MTLQEKDELLIQGECLIEVTAWAGLTSIILYLTASTRFNRINFKV
jgi:hypothetical protein